MKKTKKIKCCNIRPILVLFSSVLFCLFCSIRISAIKTVYASELKLHNYVTYDSYYYSGDFVTYYIKNKKQEFDLPGLILSNGSALGPCKEIFVDILGVQLFYTEGEEEFVLQYGTKKIELTLGNRAAYVNNVITIMPNAPVLYSFNDDLTKHLYVPTRFIAETFGFTYTWNSTEFSSYINLNSTVFDNQQPIAYDGAQLRLLINQQPIDMSEYPGYEFDGCVLLPAQQCFKKTGIASYSYSEGSGLILLKKGEILIRMILDSPVAYIDGTPYLLETVPRLLTPAGTSHPQIYIPADFVCTALGYHTEYDIENDVFCITVSDYDLWENEDDQQNSSLDFFVPDTASYGSKLFSFESHEQVIKHYTSLGYQVPVSITGYSCLNSDALYLRGIDYNTIKITDKLDNIEIEVEDCYNPFWGKYNYNSEYSYLNYCYILGNSNLRITILKMKDLHYYAYAVPNGTVIHFTNKDGMYEDFIRFTGLPTISEEIDLAGKEPSELIPEVVFNRDTFVIKLPENVTYDMISDNDDYINQKFTIHIPGNHMEFISGQEVYQPFDCLKSYKVNYKLDTDTTIITFTTTKIQAYTYSVMGGFLGIKITDPTEIYDKIIVLDAGHGGIDPGTSKGSVYEKNINYNVVNVYAKELFEQSDIKVYYSRLTDTKISLEQRAAFADAVGADFFISFHVNAHSNSSVNGTSVYYSKANNSPNEDGLSSEVLASSLLEHLVNSWNTRNMGVLTAKFIVLENNTVPAALIECGFITNTKDFQKIKDTAYQKKAAKALYDSVIELYKKY